MNRITIRPGLDPEARYALESLLGEAMGTTGKVDGGGGAVDGSSSDIFFINGCQNCVDGVIADMRRLYPERAFELKAQGAER